MAFNGNDPEVLWRRLKEFESKQLYSEAFKCALYLQRIDPKNEEVLSTLRRLNIKIQKLAEETNSTESRVKSMLKYLKDGDDGTVDLEKRIQAANNLLALVRDNAGRKVFIEQKGFDLLMASIRDTKVKYEIRLASIRVLTQLAEGSDELSLVVLKNVGIEFVIDVMSKEKDEQLLIASQTVIQTIITQLSGFSPKEGRIKDRFETQMKKYGEHVDSVMASLVDGINSRVMSGVCRDALLETLMVNMDYQALDYGNKLLDRGGLWKLLEVASELQEIHYESSMRITGNTRTHVALVLEKVFMCMDCDKAREKFYELMMQFMNSQLKGAELESKVRATAAITALLNGPIDAGNYCLGQQGIIEMMLVMANSEDIVQQCVAAEAIIAAASKKDKGKSMATMGAGILKTLFQSNNPKIKVRALVGLCKLGSVGGTDASARVFSDESSLKLLKACINLLVGASSDPGGEDVKRWAADGLAYLTLDGDLKEAFCDDRKALNALIQLGMTGDLSVLFGVVTTFVNLTNSYDKQEIIPELVELAKFSKQHVPEENELDSKEYIDARCKLLADNHVTTALVALSKSQAKTSREMICRVFNAICEQRENQGLVIQEGGTKALIKLALENNTELGKWLAGQSLARIAIHNNPELAFPGQRSIEVVKPMVELLHPDCTGLQNFEALMALTNLAQMGPSVRSRILKDGGFTKIEQYTYEEHTMIKRAATQCIVNMILAEQVVKLYEAENDRLKYLLLLVEEEDLETVKAAAGAIAMLTSVSPKATKKIFTIKTWLQTMIMLVSSKDPDLQHRGIVIVYNMIAADSESAQKVVETTLLELMMAIIRPEVDDISDTIKNIARDSLKLAEEQKLIKNIEQLQT